MMLMDDLMNLMDEINEIYLKLFRLELLGEINSSYFISLVGDLKKLMVHEETSFKKFIKSSEYEIVKEWLLNNNSNIAKRFREYVSLYECFDGMSEIEEVNKSTSEISKLYRACSRNIFLVYLSFVQEYIDTVKDNELREKMLSLKYYNAFKNLDIGNLLIEYSFSVPRVNYIDLYLTAEFIKMDDADSFDTILDANLSVITEMMKQLFEIDDIQYQDDNVLVAAKNIEFMIMACFALLSESDYEFIKDRIFDIMNENSNSNNSKASDIIDNILDSRAIYKGRVRKISLRPIED